jgi:hypothetical protein
MSEHTPGPWWGENTSSEQGLISSDVTGKNVAVAYDTKDTDLIAAAPELLEVCKAFLQIFEDGTHYDTRNPYTRPEVKAAIAAIAKAEGRD